jgi:DNA-binding response OmpR family regulator
MPPTGQRKLQSLLKSIAGDNVAPALAKDATDALRLLNEERPRLVCLRLDLKRQGRELVRLASGWEWLVVVVRDDTHLVFATNAAHLQEEALKRRLALAFGIDQHPLARRRRLVSQDRRLTIDSGRVELVKDGKTVKLSTAELELLYALAEEPGRVLSRVELLTHSGGGRKGTHAADERVIDAHIKNLRKKLEDDPRHPEYLRTAYGRGYYLQGFPRPRH